MSTHKPPCPGPEAHITHRGRPSCAGHCHPGPDAEPDRLARDGMPCANHPMRGQDVCKSHGGNTPQAKKTATQRLELAQATTEVAKLGARRDIHPAEALIELVQWTAGEVDYWRHRVTQLEDDELTWGVTKREKGRDRGERTDMTTKQAGQHIAYVMLERASDRLAAYAAAALRAGIDERRVRLAEHQGALLVQVIRQVLDQLHLTEEQQGLVPTVVPAALRTISGEAS